MKVVLFDIDGTILSSNGAGRRAVTRALHEVFGHASPDSHEFDGKTDPQIVRELMKLANVSDDVIAERMKATLDRYLELLHEELADATRPSSTYTGVKELIDALESRDDVLLGLLTGNVHGGAMAKLRAVGVETERFRVGAFGSDHGSRPELPAIARTRAEELLGHPVSGADVVVIGDTPADMSCGNGIGARAVGVATGRYSVDDLQRCNAAAVFADFSDTAAVVRAVMDE